VLLLLILEVLNRQPMLVLVLAAHSLLVQPTVVSCYACTNKFSGLKKVTQVNHATTEGKKVLNAKI
jgi:hypothetical protein